MEFDNGVQFNTTLIAVVNPPINDSEIECFATNSGVDVHAPDLDVSDQACLVNVFQR